MKKCDQWNSHISRELHLIYVSSNNDRHPVTKTLTPLHYTCRHHSFNLKLHPTTPVSTSLISIETSPNNTSLHYTCWHFTFPHLNFIQQHFTTHTFGLTPFKFPNTPFHLTTLLKFSSSSTMHSGMWSRNFARTCRLCLQNKEGYSMSFRNVRKYHLDCGVATQKTASYVLTVAYICTPIHIVLQYSQKISQLNINAWVR
jgi:hypothetical protein